VEGAAVSKVVTGRTAGTGMAPEGITGVVRVIPIIKGSTITITKENTTTEKGVTDADIAATDIIGAAVTGIT
jgi:hypothetical protein